jgi:putative ABC transport system ATP-binding protein
MALSEVSLTINQGDFVSIMGPSGKQVYFIKYCWVARIAHQVDYQLLNQK